MTDEFNLVPTNNLEKHLDNILRAASGEEPQYDLAPNWRIEQYLAAIAAKLSGGGLPAATETDNGKVLTVGNGEWTAESNALIVHFYYKDGTYTSSHTALEIKAAVDSGRPVFAFDSSGAFYVLSQSADTGATFVTFFGPSNAVTKRFVSPYGPVSIYNGSIVPSLSVSENGVELVGKNGVWTKQQKKFIVTLTPTAQDFSGTMDKTVSEINAAYEAGQEIWFKVLTGQDTYTLVPLSNVDKQSQTYPSFATYVIDIINNMLIVAWTSYTDREEKNTYSTTIYALTPAT